ncbi:MAG: histidinol dehydrogenase [Alphaproteobacteria bacterium]
MVKILRQIDKNFNENFQLLLKKRGTSDLSIESTVDKIIKNVKIKGDEEVLRLSNKFDKIKAKTFSDLIVDEKEIDKAYNSVEKSLIASLENAIKRVRLFHSKQKPSNLLYKDKEGVTLGSIWNPLESVGLYVPGGKAAYPSSFIMNVVPAQVAEVPRIVVTVPATNGYVNPLVLACCKILNIQEVYKIGGAQAVAALALGTESLKKVDKIFGPGNAYVALAKKKFFGVVGIDMIAGPSEILVFADKNNNPKHIAIDLLSQAEHDELAQSILITDCDNFSNNVISEIDSLLKKLKRRNIAKKSWEKFGAVIIVEKISDGIELINKLAPEHLEIALDNAKEYLKDIKNAGAIFLGKFTPEAIGDYIAGPNHVLPTDRTARFTSGLNLLDYFKRSSVVSCTEKSIKKIGLDAINIANEEGLQAHALSIECRIKK